MASFLLRRSLMIRMTSSTLVLALLLAGSFSLASGCTSNTNGTASTDDAGSPDGFSPPTLDASADADLGMNDVSVLVPLPKTADAPGYLAADTVGRGGVLLPQEVYAKIPAFTPTVANFERAKLRGIAVRFDGCFRKEKTDPCEAQIRIVMQPLASNLEGGGAGGGESAEATDSAVHLFYRIADADFAKVVTELRKLRSLAPETARDGALQVHPSLVAQGIEGAYGKALFNLIRGYAGADNLSRVTFFLRTPSRADQWDFGGLFKSGAEWKSMQIPGVGETQRVSLPAALPSEYAYKAEPVATTPEDLTVALSAELMQKATSEGRQAAVSALMRVENPRVHSADQIQCVSCHVARPIAVLAAQTYSMDLSKLPDTYASTTGRNLKHEVTPALAPLSVLRAFGWGGSAPAISLRVVHESAEVLDDLDKRFPKQR